MIVVNTEAISYQSQKPKKCLETAELDNNNKHLHTCLNKCWHFIPFVTSLDGLLGVEAEATLKRLDSLLATK